LSIVIVILCLIFRCCGLLHITAIIKHRLSHLLLLLGFATCIAIESSSSSLIKNLSNIWQHFMDPRVIRALKHDSGVGGAHLVD